MHAKVHAIVKSAVVETQADIEHTAALLLSATGLYSKGWRFEWSRGKRVLGHCSYRDKRIRVSEKLVPLLKPEHRHNQIVDVLLHEIAHALTPEAGHGRQWKNMARALGCRPERCYSYDKVVDKNKVAYNWRIQCANPKCNNTWHQHRLNQNMHAALKAGDRRCRRCKNSEFLIFDLRRT